MKRNIFGLLYDPVTEKVEFEDGEETPGDFTFANHEGYNPLQYATEATADKLVSALSKLLPKDCKITKVWTEVEGPIAPPPQILLHVSRSGIGESFNAGLIANSFIRSGSFASFRQDLKLAGILF